MERLQGSMLDQRAGVEGKFGSFRTHRWGFLHNFAQPGIREKQGATESMPRAVPPTRNATGAGGAACCCGRAQHCTFTAQALGDGGARGGDRLLASRRVTGLAGRSHVPPALGLPPLVPEMQKGICTICRAARPAQSVGKGVCRGFGTGLLRLPGPRALHCQAALCTAKRRQQAALPAAATLPLFIGVHFKVHFNAQLALVLSLSVAAPTVSGEVINSVPSGDSVPPKPCNGGTGKVLIHPDHHDPGTSSNQ